MQRPPGAALTVHESELLLGEARRLREERMTYITQISLLASALRDLRTRAGTLSAEVQVYRHGGPALSELLAQRDAEISRSRSEIDDLKAQLSDALTAKDEAEAKAKLSDELSATISSLGSKLAEAEQRNRDLLQRVSSLQRENSELLSRSQRLQACLQKADRGREALEQALRKAGGALEALLASKEWEAKHVMHSLLELQDPVPDEASDSRYAQGDSVGSDLPNVEGLGLEALEFDATQMKHLTRLKDVRLSIAEGALALIIPRQHRSISHIYSVLEAGAMAASLSQGMYSALYSRTLRLIACSDNGHGGSGGRPTRAQCAASHPVSSLLQVQPRCADLLFLSCCALVDWFLQVCVFGDHLVSQDSVSTNLEMLFGEPNAYTANLLTSFAAVATKTLSDVLAGIQTPRGLAAGVPVAYSRALLRSLVDTAEGVVSGSSVKFTTMLRSAPTPLEQSRRQTTVSSESLAAGASQHAAEPKSEVRDVEIAEANVVSASYCLRFVTSRLTQLIPLAERLNVSPSVLLRSRPLFFSLGALLLKALGEVYSVIDPGHANNDMEDELDEIERGFVCFTVHSFSASPQSLLGALKESCFSLASLVDRNLEGLRGTGQDSLKNMHLSLQAVLSIIDLLDSECKAGEGFLVHRRIQEGQLRHFVFPALNTLLDSLRASQEKVHLERELEEGIAKLETELRRVSAKEKGIVELRDLWARREEEARAVLQCRAEEAEKAVLAREELDCQLSVLREQLARQSRHLFGTARASLLGQEEAREARVTGATGAMGAMGATRASSPARSAGSANFASSASTRRDLVWWYPGEGVGLDRLVEEIMRNPYLTYV